MPISMSDFLILLIALYGAALSTVLAVREIKREKRQIQVTCKMTLVPAPTGGVWEFVKIHAVNTGHRPVQITSAGLNMSNGYQFIQLRSNMGPIPLPKKIDDHDDVSVFFDYPVVERALRENPNAAFTSAFVRDTEGNEYRSKLPRELKIENDAKGNEDRSESPRVLKIGGPTK